MKKYGYVTKKTNDGKQLFVKYEALVAYGCEQVIISEANLTSLEEIKEAFHAIQKGDQLVFYNIKSLEKTVEELSVFLELAKENQVTVFFLEEQLSSEKKLVKNLGETLEFVLRLQRQVLTTKKVSDDKKSVKPIGRPKIEEAELNQIIFYYEKKKMSYREISRLTKLSLGTVHKYINEYKSQQR